MTSDQPNEQGAAPAVKTSGLAVASLICGLLWGCGLLSLIGLILGVVALVKIKNSRGRLGGQGIALAGTIVSAVLLVLSLVILPIMAGILLPAISSARAAARKAACFNNVRCIGLALEMYSSGAYHGQMPLDLECLYNNGNDLLSDPKAFACPAAGEGQAAPGKLRVDYIYLNPKNDDPPNRIILVDKPGNHRDGGNALYKDMHVKFIRTASPGDYAAFVKALQNGDRGTILGFAPDCSNGRRRAAGP